MDKLFRRVKGLLLAPNAEWPVIAAEPGAMSAPLSYMALLALVPALAYVIGSSLIGGYTTLLSSLMAAVSGYVLTFAAVSIIALIADVLAPSFESQRNFVHAFKLTVYSHTPVWLAGVFLLVPGLSFLTILGLYGIYLFWLGLPPLMGTPFSKTAVYAAAVAACALLFAVAIGFMQAGVLGWMRPVV